MLRVQVACGQSNCIFLYVSLSLRREIRLSSSYTSLLADLQFVAGICFKESYLSFLLSTAKTSQCNTETFKIHFASLFAQPEIYSCHQPENPYVETADLLDKPCQNSLGSLGDYCHSLLPKLHLAKTPDITREKITLENRHKVISAAGQLLTQKPQHFISCCQGSWNYG